MVTAVDLQVSSILDLFFGNNFLSSVQALATVAGLMVAPLFARRQVRSSTKSLDESSFLMVIESSLHHKRRKQICQNLTIPRSKCQAKQRTSLVSVVPYFRVAEYGLTRH